MTAELIKMRETKGSATSNGNDTVKVKAAAAGAKPSGGGCC
jgi:hypothetical protein